MDRDLLKHAPFFAIVAVISFSIYYMKHSWQTELVLGPKVETQSYRMPRAVAPENEYDISGRKIVRNTIYPNGNPANAPVPPAAPAAGANKAPAPRSQPAAVAAKKTDPKKSGTQAAKKFEMGVRVVGNSDKKMSGLSADANAGNSPASQPISAVAQVQQPAPAATDQQTPDEPKMTASQWRSLLFSAPTAANGANFIKAFQNGEISGDDFYQISDDLMVDSAADRQKMGLAIFRQQYSVKAFSHLTARYHDSGTPDSLKTLIYPILKSYGDPSHFNVLSAALDSTDLTVVDMATKVLSLTVASQQQATSLQPRDTRTPGSSTVVIKGTQFQTFVPALKRLVAGKDKDVAAQAQTLLDSIQALMKA